MIKNRIIIFTILMIITPAILHSQIDKWNSKNKQNKSFVWNNYSILCNVGELEVLLHYGTAIATSDNRVGSFGYPKGTNNYYTYAANFWYMYKTESGEIRMAPAANLQYLANKAGVNGIIDASVMDVDSPDWAISHLDTRSDWYDKYDEYRNPNGSNIWGTVITHAWSEYYRDDFIMWEITLKNMGQDTIRGLYIGKKMDCDISSHDGGSGAGGFWRDDLVNFYTYETPYLIDGNKNIYVSYMFDGDSPNVPGDDTGGRKFPKESPAFIGTITITSPPTSDGLFPDNQPSGHTWWDWNSDPSSRKEIYGYLAWGSRNINEPYRPMPPSPHDYRYLVSWGPYNIMPNESITIRLATGLGNSPEEYFFNPKHPIELGLQGLLINLTWAKLLYCSSFPISLRPPAPELNYQTDNNKVILTWDNSAENSIDPITGKADFEGYRLWKSTDSEHWELLGEWDKINGTGKNTGLVHSYTDYSVQNGFKYYYSLTAFDRGVPELGLRPLESSKSANRISVIPGTSPSELNKGKITVAPNPYYANATWNRKPGIGSPVEDRIGFFGLTSWADIYIYTLSGDLVDKIEHRNPNLKVAFWDGLTKYSYSAVSGVYLYVVEDKKGNKFTGKFVIVR